MARRSDHSREELKEMALNTAIEVIENEGLASLSVRSITKKIGYTVGTLYQLFKNLDDVVLHVNAQTLDELYLHIEKASLQERPIYRMAKCYIEYSRNYFHRWNALFTHRLPDGEALPDWYQEKVSRIFQVIEQAVEKESLASGQENTERTARILWAGLHGICSLSITGKLDTVGAESADVLAHHFINSFMAGLDKA